MKIALRGEVRLFGYVQGEAKKAEVFSVVGVSLLGREWGGHKVCVI